MYEYDVFISYRRVGSDVPAWIRNHFYPRLSEVLDNNLDRDMKIFFDELVPSGATWPAALRTALQRARILLPVCSPKYFVDEWCLAEWKSMELREKLAGLASPEQQPQNLIYPVIFSDSERFPKYATDRRMRNFKSWNHPHPQFERSMKYLEFDDEVKRIAAELARLLDQVPAWRPDWPVETPAADPPKPAGFPRL